MFVSIAVAIGIAGGAIVALVLPVAYCISGWRQSPPPSQTKAERTRLMPIRESSSEALDLSPSFPSYMRKGKTHIG
jgi:hypothetical protein